MTRRTAISLPDDLFAEMERARRRDGRDRSTWLQEAASDYLKKRTRAQEEEDWLSAYERTPLSVDERALDRWKQTHWSLLLEEEQTAKPAKRRRR